MKPHVVNHLGVARTFQNIRLFPALTALENVKVGIETRQQVGLDRRNAAACPAAPRGAGEHQPARTSCWPTSACASEPTTWPCRSPTASSGAWRSPARWAPNPAVVLLDEPAAGTNPAEKRELAELIKRINVDAASACC